MNKVDTSAEKILILEDHDKPLITLTHSLTQEGGYHIETTSNPREIFKLLRQRRPDLILLDLTLVGESGIRLCERIRQEEDEQVSIILISDKGSQEDKDRGFEAGAEDYLVKPLR